MGLIPGRTKLEVVGGSRDGERVLFSGYRYGYRYLVPIPPTIRYLGADSKPVAAPLRVECYELRCCAGDEFVYQFRGTP